MYGQAGEAAREARRRAREVAEQARARMHEAQREAEAEGGPRYAALLWAEAEARATEAAHALAGEAFSEARDAFDSVGGTYGRVRDIAREARVREAAERARAQATRGRERAQAAGGPGYASELWEAAEAKFSEGETAIARKPPSGAAQAFDDAGVLFARAEDGLQTANPFAVHEANVPVRVDNAPMTGQ